MFYSFLLAQKGVQKGHPSSPGLTARSLWPGKGELQKLTPFGCSDMLRPAEVPLGCNSNPFAEPQRAQGWMGNCNKDALRALFYFSAPAHAGAAITLYFFFVLDSGDRIPIKGKAR
ncbi:MAG: hypothetical protein C0613_06765 [Desulfobulbaceae bacterium]|nr:MAG: hypothetical protein C0613_06765 [Desulfobulbaceae bacterium]